jgi:hypothetical protein
MSLPPLQHQALLYLCHTHGQATHADFLDDFAPCAVELWQALQAAGWVCEDAEGALRLTAAGEAVLEATILPPEEDC